MNCENEYCVYNKKYECMLDEISLDTLGRCMECICVDIPHKQLKKPPEVRWFQTVEKVGRTCEINEELRKLFHYRPNEKIENLTQYS